MIVREKKITEEVKEVAMTMISAAKKKLGATAEFEVFSIAASSHPWRLWS